MDFDDFKPCLLIAMPELQDPNFMKSVVLLSDFTEEGAIGFIVNRPSHLKLGQSVQLSEGEINPQYNNLGLWSGGPVDPEQIWIIYQHQFFPIEKGVPLNHTLALAKDVSILTSEKTLDSDHFRVVHGYAGWDAQQLCNEIAGSSWITAPISNKLIFETAPENMWHQAIQNLGINPNHLVGPNSSFLN